MFKGPSVTSNYCNKQSKLKSEVNLQVYSRLGSQPFGVRVEAKQNDVGRRDERGGEEERAVAAGAEDDRSAVLVEEVEVLGGRLGLRLVLARGVRVRLRHEKRRADAGYERGAMERVGFCRRSYWCSDVLLDATAFTN